MASLEEVKALLHEALTDEKVRNQRIAEAIEMLDACPDPIELAKRAKHHADRRQGARRRAKIAAQHSVHARIVAIGHADHPNGNTWRDGYVRGLEDAHATIGAVDDADPDDGG